jgi:hypothetical protein
MQEAIEEKTLCYVVRHQARRPDKSEGNKISGQQRVSQHYAE